MVLAAVWLGVSLETGAGECSEILTFAVELLPTKNKHLGGTKVRRANIYE